MTERRYNDEEVAEIFRIAAESTQKSQPLLPSAEGMTLAQLQEIGREVGISSDQLAAASRSMDVALRPTSRRFLGFPIGVGLTVELHRTLSDAEWERLVVDLRETFDARGQQKRDGSLRQWTNGNLQVLLEPSQTGSRVRFRTVNGNAQTMMFGGLAVLGASALIALTNVLHMSGLETLLSMSTPLAIGAGIFGFGALRLPAWARTRQHEMEEVATRLALAPSSDIPARP